jgi:hypothetical protein
MDIDVDLTRIEEAARTVDPVFRDSPQFVSEQLSAELGRTVLVKIETVNPLGSFKGRGAAFLVNALPLAALLCVLRAGISVWPSPMPRGTGAWAPTCTFHPALTLPGWPGCSLCEPK